MNVSSRRGLLKSGVFLVAGAAGGMLLPRWFSVNDVALAQGNDTLIVLSAIRAELGSLDKVVRLVKTFGMVNCMPNFTDTPRVINGFNDLMTEVFGERAGKGVRSAIGMNTLPDGSAVEIETIFQVRA